MLFGVAVGGIDVLVGSAVDVDVGRMAVGVTVGNIMGAWEAVGDIAILVGSAVDVDVGRIAVGVTAGNVGVEAGVFEG